MLVLSRRPGQAIVIGADVEVVVLECDGAQVRLSVRAPREVPVFRRELLEQIQAENRRAAASVSSDVLAGMAARLG
jgi:carbon storage regulator